MQQFTLADLKGWLNEELDLTDDEPISESEKTRYLNEGISEAEAEIHTLSRESRYFYASLALALDTGQQNYGLPENIYANKIIKIMYHNGSVIYEITRMKRRNNMSVEEQIAQINQFGSDDDYQYIVKNDSSDFGNEIWLYPASRETSQDVATIWYIRKANVLSEDDDMCDIPEFAPFVLQFAKVKAMRKLFMGNVPQAELDELQRQRTLMVDTLTTMVVDDDTELEHDFSHYFEHL